MKVTTMTTIVTTTDRQRMAKIPLSSIHEFVLENARCNFHCSYCHSGYSDGRNGHSCRPVVFNREWFEENLEFGPVRRIRLWGGEPCLNWDVYREVIEFFAPYAEQMSFICNGSLLTPAIASFCVEHNVRVHFSHDLSDQHFRGVDYLKTKQFKESAEILRNLFPDWKIALRKVYHGKSSTFAEDAKYLEGLHQDELRGFGFKVALAFGRGFRAGDEHIWKAEDLLRYLRDMLDYCLSGGLLAQSFISHFVRRNLAVWNAATDESRPHAVCPATRAYFEGRPFALGSTGHVGHCHCNLEYPRNREMRETCKKCPRNSYCMGSCLVTDNSAQCGEWGRLYDGIVEMMGKLIAERGLENVRNLESYRWYEE